MDTGQGRFVWHDLGTSNVDGATTFYPPLTGWTTQPWEEARSYTMWLNRGTAVGGVLPLGHPLGSWGSAPHWMPYVCVYDVDACARQVKKLGGSIVHGPYEMPNVGCWAEICDPTGGRIGMFEPAQNPPPARPSVPGEFSWHELWTDDAKAALDFYKELFTWEQVSEFDMGAMGIYRLFGQKGQQFGGMFDRRPDMPPSMWLSYVQVPDIQAAAKQVPELGGRILNGPMEVPGGDWIVQCSDPAGAMFALHAKAAS
jgi:predicted enzyme related to lactoylglutathione lyase